MPQCNQINQWEEIVKYMKLIETRQHVDSEDENISIPSREMPAYFEWVLLRSFLAIDHLMIPASARGFKLTKICVLKVMQVGRLTVNLPILFLKLKYPTNSDRHGERRKPVQRHILDTKKEYPDLPAYGLFLAPKLDANTLVIFANSEYWDEKQNGKCS